MGIIKGCLLFAGGIAFGSMMTTDKALESDRIRNAVADEVAMKVKGLLFDVDDSKATIPVRHDYRSYYSYYPSRISQKSAAPSFDFRDIIFYDRSVAEKLLNEMESTKNTYGVVSVADMYDLASIACHTYTASNYGWTDLSAAKIVRGRNGYFIQFPKVTEIKGIN